LARKTPAGTASFILLGTCLYIYLSFIHYNFITECFIILCILISWLTSSYYTFFHKPYIFPTVKWHLYELVIYTIFFFTLNCLYLSHYNNNLLVYYDIFNFVLWDIPTLSENSNIFLNGNYSFLKTHYIIYHQLEEGFSSISS